MRKPFYVFVIIGLVFLSGMLFTPAHSQGEVRISRLEVDLWPEYDQPSVLVIYHITVPSTVSLPVDLNVRIPAAAGEPSAVAVRQMTAEGQPGLFTITHQRQVLGEWGVISLTATMPEVQIEYYYPGLAKQGDQRQFEYRWPGDYAVDAFSVQVQQPLGASEMSLSPASGGGITGNDGLVYYTKDIGALNQGQTFSLSFQYKKSGDDLSASNLKLQPSAPVTSVTPGQDSLMAVLPWALGGLGVALIAGGGVWYYYSGRQKGDDQPRRRRRRATDYVETQDDGGFIYCHQCGKRASPGDVFCRTCGTRLRVE